MALAWKSRSKTPFVKKILEIYEKEKKIIIRKNNKIIRENYSKKKFIVKVFFELSAFCKGRILIPWFFCVKFYRVQSISTPFISHLSGSLPCWTPWSSWIHSNLEYPFILWLNFFHNHCRECCCCQEPRGAGIPFNPNLSKPAAAFSCHGEDSHGEHFPTQTRTLSADSRPYRFVLCSVASSQAGIPHFPQKFLIFGAG